MSDDDIEFVDELPPSTSKPKAKAKPKPVEKTKQERTPPKNFEEPSPGSTNDIVHMGSGEIIECDCGESEVRRIGDKYMVSGPMYNLQGVWLKCHKCADAVRIGPTVKWIDVDAKGQ